MQLAIITAVLVTLACSQHGGEAVSGVAWRMLVVIGSTLLAPLIALAATHTLSARGDSEFDKRTAVPSLEWFLTWSWLGATAIILFVAQWPRIVSANWELSRWPVVDELVILAPVVGSLLLVWAVLYRFEHLTAVAACREGQTEPPPSRMAAYLWLQVRQQFGLILLPPLLVLGVVETLSSLNITPAKLDTAWWIALPLAATTLLLMPAAVRRVWKTTPLPPGPVRSVLDAICVSRKCYLREILVWDTSHTVANAAVVGISRWLRYMLLSDVLLARLSITEVAAVVRHEVAHLRRWHLPLRLALLVLPLAWWAAIKHRWPALESGLGSALGAPNWLTEATSMLILPLGMLAYAVVVVGWYSRLLEHDADLDACLTATGQFDPAWAIDFRRALWTICPPCMESRSSQWLHPPLASRFSFLDRVIDDQQVATAFRERLRRIAFGIAVLYLAAVLVAIS
jgi:Zn-dependent protease with chaperone function